MGHGMSRGDHPASHVVAWRAYTAMERNVMQMIVEAAAARPRPAALPVPIAQLPPPLRQALSHLDSAALVPVDAVLALLPWQTLDPSPGEDPDLVFRSPTPAATATTAPGMGSPPPGATLMRRGGAVFPATAFESPTLRGLGGTMNRSKRTTMFVVDEDGNPVDLIPPGTVPVFPDEVPLLLSELENTVNVGLCSRDLVELTPSLAMLRNASVLQLCCNSLTRLPREIGYLTHLTVLSVAKNQLSQLPTTIGHLAHLIELDVSQNVLTDLPTSIGRLRRLHVLKADRNRLTALPAQLGRLAALVTLDVSENPLRVLPAELATLKHLRKVRTRGCPLWSARAAAAAPGRVMPLGIDPENDVAAAGPGAGLPPPPGLPADLGAGLAAHAQAAGGGDHHQPRTLSRRAAAAAALAAVRPTSDELGLPEASDDKQWTGVLSLREMVARTLIRTNAVVDLAQLPRDLAAHLCAYQQCSFCHGPYIAQCVRRHRVVAKGDARLPLEYRLCRPHWHSEQERIAVLFGTPTAVTTAEADRAADEQAAELVAAQRARRRSRRRATSAPASAVTADGKRASFRTSLTLGSRGVGSGNDTVRSTRAARAARIPSSVSAPSLVTAAGGGRFGTPPPTPMSPTEAPWAESRERSASVTSFRHMMAGLLRPGTVGRSAGQRMSMGSVPTGSISTLPRPRHVHRHTVHGVVSGRIDEDAECTTRAEVRAGDTIRRRLHDVYDETDDEKLDEEEEDPEEDLAAWDPDVDVERYDVYDVMRGGLPTKGPIRALVAMRRLPPLLDPRPSPSDLAKATAATRPKWFPTATPTTTAGATPISTPTYGIFMHPRAASAPPLRSTPLPYDAPLTADDSMLLFGTAPRRTRARSGSYFDWEEAGSASASTSLAPAAEAHTLPAGIEPALSATSMSVTLPTLAASTPSSSVPIPAGSSPAPSVVAAAAAGGAWMVDDLEPAPLEPDAVDTMDAGVLEQVLASDDGEMAQAPAAPRTSRGSKTSVSSSVVAGLAGLAARVRFGRWRASSASSPSGGTAGRARAGRDGDVAGAAASSVRGSRY
ncbi:hypothetical protein AMAG_12370 [Allomyces macrogynus ATCC 38327]|uniref:Disease resistance R13L4/SHOC-2-like LRR domain-containing protein n=1 Tax=Allomyces macrogynus (strain ATCC 38327) TaxID=578462 RepID=A0A0L0SY81_ALLM3|nr:hypothetical protein AMAG_12370 [Allomyces macrogynus ATCC 38327]|eukprot:KNE67304.1 hypothetical protein AMAG_12370 [Allomyces macrogynus ATCC 38327]